MSKKSAHHEEHIDESWLIPYADLLTLLLALFIVLFASSNVDSEKYKKVSDSFKKELGLLEPSSDKLSLLPPTEIQGNIPTDANIDNKAKSDSTGLSEQVAKQIENLNEQFETYVKENNLTEQVKVEKKGDGVLIILTSDVWFPPGSADITQAQSKIAGEVSKMIVENEKPETPLNVIVSGHTDNTPINTPQFESNWELSVARAVNFMKELIKISNLNPARFSARGLGEFEPIDTNNSPQGRQHNRRVEVYISP